MPDLRHQPDPAGVVMSAGMMPALDFPGLIRPGQFGPMIRVVPVFWTYWKNSAVSWTGTPSVITTTSGTPGVHGLDDRGLGERRAARRPPRRRRRSAATASATVPKTGSVAPSKSTVSPALPGLTPPTMRVPESSIRWVCLRPSEPVMPWTMTVDCCGQEDRHRCCPLLRRRGGELGHAARGAVHGVDHLDHGRARPRRGSRRPSSALLPSSRTTIGLSGVSPCDLSISKARTIPSATASHAVIPPKTLTKTALTVGVAQDDLQAVGHHLGAGAAADVEEVGRLDAAELLTGVGDDVERAHHQAGAVADDADLAVAA